MKAESDNSQPNLKTLRERADLTQPQLSQRLGVGIRIIGDWESGRKTPRLDNAIALARELGISLKTLAMAMRIEVEDIPDDGLSLAQLKAVCRQLGIERIEELPDNFTLLLLPRQVDSERKPLLDMED